MNIQILLSLLFIGILAGVLSGILGVGGGVIMVPLLIMFLGFSQHQAQGTSLAIMLPPVTLLAVLNYHKEGLLNWKYALIVSAMFIVGGYLGSKLALQIDQKVLRKIFAGVLVVIAAKMFFAKS